MMRSLFAGVAGLKNHQTRMDVIGNNIANVNTVGFKRGRVNFQEMLVQTLRGASSPQAGRGGVNAMQVGLGVSSGSIDTIQTQGNLQSTGKNTDMALQGDGYFILQDGSGQVFTRSGVFDLDKEGNLINSSNGMKVMGWMANPTTGIIDPNSALTTLNVPMGQSMEPKDTEQVTYANNLDASASPGATHVVAIDVFDSLGTAHKITTTFTKDALIANRWSVADHKGHIPHENQ
ncbi:MAG TPA: flagellar hook-basal body complex protein [Bacillota bacterium]|nr:flagellar hook-basal body complex protein [Bacillota bacterium]